MKQRCKYLTGWCCVYCGHFFPHLHILEHPETIEFINGYPAPCRNIGRHPFELRTENEWSWVRPEYRETRCWFEWGQT